MPEDRAAGCQLMVHPERYLQMGKRSETFAESSFSAVVTV